MGWQVAGVDVGLRISRLLFGLLGRTCEIYLACPFLPARKFGALVPELVASLLWSADLEVIPRRKAACIVLCEMYHSTGHSLCNRYV